MSEYFKTLSGDDLADIARLLAKPVRMPLDYDDFHIYHKTCRNLLAEVRRLTTALENARKDAFEEPGIGFFDAVGRALCAAYEKDGPDQLTDEFRAWNEARKAP